MRQPNAITSRVITARCRSNAPPHKKKLNLDSMCAEPDLEDEASLPLFLVGRGIEQKSFHHACRELRRFAFARRFRGEPPKKAAAP